MTTVAQAIAGGRRLGRFAARTARPVTSCPYPPRSGDPVQEAGRIAWLQAYRRIRPYRPAETALLSDVDLLATGEDVGLTVDGRPVVPNPPLVNLF